MKQMNQAMIEAGIYGVCVADAYGLPVQFMSRKEVRAQHLTGMTGYGTYGMPVGSWSDDGSMTLCLAYSLAEKGGVDYEDIMARFVDWMYNGACTPTGRSYDIGGSCSSAVRRGHGGTPALQCGDTGGSHNGNGSLMRILPAAFWMYSRYGADPAASAEAMEIIHNISALTHAHPIAKSACGIYVNIACRLLDGMPLAQAAEEGVNAALAYYRTQPAFSHALHVWSRIADLQTFRALPDSEINSGGYVVDTLEAALYCLLNTGSYRDCVMKIVNLGEDTDSTAAVAGGLAALAYGAESIPAEWRAVMQRPEILDGTVDGLTALFCPQA